MENTKVSMGGDFSSMPLDPKVSYAQSLVKTSGTTPPSTLEDIRVKGALKLDHTMMVKKPSVFQGEPALFFSSEEIEESSTPFRFTLIAKCAFGRPSSDDLKIFLKKTFHTRMDFSISILDAHHALIRFESESDYLVVWLEEVGPSLARICVEIDLNKEKLKRFWLGMSSEGRWQPIIYEKELSYCSSCKKLGHKMDLCKMGNRSYLLRGNNISKTEVKKSDLPVPIIDNTANKYGAITVTTIEVGLVSTNKVFADSSGREVMISKNSEDANLIVRLMDLVVEASNQIVTVGALAPKVIDSFYVTPSEEGFTTAHRHSEKVFLNGDVYVGNFKGLLPHGNGKYTWSDGTIYEGDWEDGKMTGQGKIYWSSGATYKGDFSGCYLHGFGTFTGLDGSIYRGAWRMNIQHGLGRKQYPSSDIYEGSWKEGVQDGSGRYDWNTGNAYIGNWKAGKMCGRGVMKWTNGDLFDGLWLDGLRHGSGFYRYVDGGYYFGTWTRGLKDGPGTFYPSGSKLPSLTKLYSSIGHNDSRQSLLSHSLSVNLEEFRVREPSVKRSLSEKLSIGDFFRSFGRMSYRATPLHGDWSLGDSSKEIPSQDSSRTLSFTFGEGQHEVQDTRNLVYEREYMQGVLIKEKVRNNAAGLSDKNKQRNKSQAKELKKQRGENIFKGHRSYYLMLDLQLGISQLVLHNYQVTPFKVYRYTVGKITPVPMREVRSSDFGSRARIRMYFPRKGSEFTPPHYSIGFHWKDYCPMVFRYSPILFLIHVGFTLKFLFTLSI
ncbi:hypothetical protein HHK36_030417 [Tetracentron sinense]|uniref:Phosphatidylinositol 4-phosphate 5-kinase n=1 Tax=Tetracentron sinense TaxID=13715 RepID=A0A834YB26_TETSI|nr:hypothetical protein HHK36_030417 [Tetracentron sinense]